ncbi:ArsR family transcriptional regulator [Roseibium sp. TrichSKD4]|uniref:ArsR/SmtB family transcription factor n=1 Tax=Roseibium sp. TrichSKD4 TaxID=744980 RepID=UPI0001E569DD|nr:metalloregulator ArsR/SmtB family transcription factor [Roseibium sp. TrichSKD4]EFO31851.1 ArsR family transcriptional regulator [Roseibium sp. TrichSKD4]
MELDTAAGGFAALGSEARMQVLLSLVRAGGDGLTVGEIQVRTGMAASTLAHHLRLLTTAGLVEQEKQGRSVINRAAFSHLEELAGYILKECCADQKCTDGAAA